MISIPKYIRVTQTREQVDEYTVYNALTGDEFIIDQTTYDILHEINNVLQSSILECKKIIDRFASNSKEVFEVLFSENIVLDIDRAEKNDNILEHRNVKYPMTTVTIEITNLCSLNCIHCYGQFGKNKNKMEYTMQDMRNLKSEFDYLHVQSIILTGGDVFLNNDIIDITKYLLENGFKISILSNGWADISTFCRAVKEYHLSMVFSIDGLEKTHDYIRGRIDSFKHVLQSVDVAYQYDNITVGINTTVMKLNLNEMKELQKNISDLYPGLIINLGLIIPCDDVNESFELNEMEYVYQTCPEVLRKLDKGKERIERCRGGVSFCSLGADRNVSICAAAIQDKFSLGNLNTSKLSEIWLNPPIHIQKMRQEKQLGREQCVQCSNQQKCKSIQDCRIYAEQYTKDMKTPNPICCFVASKKR